VKYNKVENELGKYNPPRIRVLETIQDKALKRNTRIGPMDNVVDEYQGIGGERSVILHRRQQAVVDAPAACVALTFRAHHIIIDGSCVERRRRVA
jgi:hypothetical protein